MKRTSHICRQTGPGSRQPLGKVACLLTATGLMAVLISLAIHQVRDRPQLEVPEATDGVFARSVTVHRRTTDGATLRFAARSLAWSHPQLGPFRIGFLAQLEISDAEVAVLFAADPNSGNGSAVSELSRTFENIARDAARPITTISFMTLRARLQQGNSATASLRATKARWRISTQTLSLDDAVIDVGGTKVLARELDWQRRRGRFSTTRPFAVIRQDRPEVHSPADAPEVIANLLSEAGIHL
jgi:hypothetical protein